MHDKPVVKPAVVLSLLAMVHIVLSIVLLEAYGGGGDWESWLVYTLTYSLMYSQVSLTSLWVGFGKRHHVYRWGAFAGAIGLWVYLTNSPDDEVTKSLALLVWHAALVVLAAIGVRFLGVRLVAARETIPFDGSPAPAANDRIGRFDLSQVFAVTTVIATMAATAGLRGMSFPELWLTFVDRGAFAAVAIASAWAMLAPGPSKWRVLLVVVCSSVFGGGRSAILGTSIYYAALFGAHALGVCGSLAAIRACGYRLILLPDRAKDIAQTA